MSSQYLHIIDLAQAKAGYRHFISCLVHKSPKLTVIIDPGPRSTVDVLKRELEALEVDRIDFVLLTHIHLDHAGSVAQLLQAYPEARAYCHVSGQKHLVDPQKLWAGTKKVLGDVAQLYGEPSPVPAQAFVSEQDLANRDIMVVPTPGHAPHHVAFVYDGILFAGEALGTRIELPSGKPYLRPATPPRFFYEEAQQSISRLAALDPEPHTLAFAHFGTVDTTRVWCARAAQQLELWLETAKEVKHLESPEREETYFNLLQKADPLYGQGRYDELPEDLKERERHFVGNTLAGMMSYLG